MKAQILKLGGVTTEAEFYKKFPTEKAFMAKHGKKLEKLKKAQGGGSLIPGLEGTGGTTSGAFINKAGQVDSISGKVSRADTEALGFGDNPPKNSGGFDYGSLIGPAIVGAQDAQASSAYNKKLDQYLELSNLIGRIPQNRQQRPQYIHPEQQLVTGATPKGVAENGAMIGGNPTEIQNMYNIGDIYTDLEDTNPKQYQLGGQLANVNAGWNNDGIIGTKSQGWQTASNLTKNIPGLGLVVDFMGQTQANEKAGMLAKKQAPIFNNLAAVALQNVNAGQFSANVKYGGSFDYMEDGGWVSHDWQPQVITKFGDADVSQVHAFAQDGMPQYRAGGHLREYTPPSAEAMNTGKAEFGGELKTLWGGDIKQVGVNPIIGPLGILSGGYHSQRAKDAPGQKGIGVMFGNNIIEAEDREGVAMLANGGEIDPATGQAGKSAYIFGAEKIQGWAKKAIEDPDIKVGTTFKHWFDTKSKLQKKLNKQELAAREELANLSVDDPYDQLKMNRLMKTLEGVQMQNVDLAKYIANGAAVQTAINETDEEMGTAKYGGKLKKAEFGAKITTAKQGTSLSGVDPAVSGLIALLKKKGYDLQVSSGLRPGAKTKKGKPSRHAVGEAVDVVFPKLGPKAYNKLLKDKDVIEYMMDNGLTALNEYDPKVARETGASGPHIHFGKDSGTGLANRFRNAVKSTYENIKNAAGDASDFFSDNFLTPNVKSNVSDLYVKPKTAKATATPTKKTPVVKQPVKAAATPVQTAAPVSPMDNLDLEVNRRNAALLNPKVSTLPKSTASNLPRYSNTDYLPSQGMGLPSDGLLERLNELTTNLPSFASLPVLAEQSVQQPVQQPVQQQMYQAPAMQQMQAQAQPQAQTQAQAQPDTEYTPIKQTSSPSAFSKGLQKLGSGLEGLGKQVMPGLQSALPYLRPSNQMPMDPQALTGEMFALATNQLEPVQAQKFVPYLTQGIQISLQDQMNEVTAQTRAAERLARGNPEALAMIAAQAYDAKNRIKGEEFRLNQGEKQRVAETNRQVLNEANKMNLGIMDQQYVRQQTAKSKTKEQAITALNSISDKILKNKLENRELGIYENLYGFRFGPNGQAYNTNLTTFNTPNVGQGATSLNDLTPLEKKKVLDDARKAKTTQTATAGQGAIVKSMHEL
jgi:hypothetical protein